MRDKLNSNIDLITASQNSVNEYIQKIKDLTNNSLSAMVITHGCQMNEHDSEKIKWLLEKMGYKLVEDKNDSDLIILNTCSVRHSAEDKVYGQLGILKHLKNTKKNLKIGVCGCMMQREASRNYVIDKFENVDIIFGTNNIWKMPELLYKSYNGQKLSIDIQNEYSDLDNNLGSNRLYPFKSYVNIMYGCNNFCTFCIVPYTRGREKSREPQDILDEVTSLINRGSKEITLLGQNVNSYGNGLENKITFTDLLYKINELDGIERIRFMTSHPKDISPDLIYAFRDLDHLCNFLHLPVQSGSSRILKRMNRRYTKEDYLRKIDKIKEINPNIALSTDIMIGFPGETEEDFEETLDLVKKVEYDTSFTFLYSMRTGTPAAKISEQVTDEIKHDRFQRLLDVLYPIQYKKNKTFLNKTVKVLAEDVSRKDPNKISGRNDEFKLINFLGSNDDIGKIVNVKITSCNSFSLEGVKVEY